MSVFTKELKNDKKAGKGNLAPVFPNLQPV